MIRVDSHISQVRYVHFGYEYSSSAAGAARVALMLYPASPTVHTMYELLALVSATSQPLLAFGIWGYYSVCTAAVSEMASREEWPDLISDLS